MGTEKPSPRKNGCIGCIGKLALLLWVFIVGIGVGAWLGFNLARLYPALNIPAPPFLNIPVANPSVQANDGLQITVTRVTRSDQRIDVYFTLTNNGLSPIEPRAKNFYLLDAQQRRFNHSSGVRTDINDTLDTLAFNAPINPGLSSSYHLAFETPSDARGLRLMYNGVSVGISW